MAKSQGQVTKIYQLRTLGYDEIHKQLQAVAKDFDAIKKAKKEAETGVANATNNEDLVKYRTELQKVKLEEAELRKQRQQLITEAKAEQLARQAIINQQKEEKKNAEAATGSYAALYRQYRQLYDLVKKTPEGQAVTFQGQILSFDQAIAKLKQLSAAEQDFRRQFQRDQLLVGEYTSGIVQAFKRLGLDDLIGGQITKAQGRLKDLNASFESLKQELSEVKVSGQGSLEGIEFQLIENRKETIALQKQLGSLQTEFRGTGDIGNQITSSIGNGFKNAGKQLTQLLVGYLGFQAVFSGITRSVDIAKDLSDETTNLEVELGKAKGGAEGLVNQLAKLDTRTKLTVLEQIANIAAKAGVSEKELVGVTAAIDKIKIAFGKDFGNVEEGTESLVKLINIFLGTEAVTGENLLRVGNAVRTLANESVASVPFLNDFSKRMAGLKGISDITLPSVLGLASGFEQFGQSSEVSATALVKIIPKLATDTAKYAQIAGVTNEAFKELLNNRPEEALLKVAESLVKGKTGIEDVSTAFADSELGKGRITAVLGVLGKNADEFRKSIDSAGRSFSNTGNIEAAFAAKNENLAATLDKVSKRFADAANSKAFQVTILAIATTITFLLNSLPVLLVLGGLLAVNWAVQNAQLLLLRAQVIGYNIGIGASYIGLAALTIVQTAYNAVLFVTNGALGLVTKALAFFGITVRATTGPLGVILTLIGLLAAAYAAFGKSVSSGITSLNEWQRRQRLNIETLRAASDSIAEQTSKLDVWITVIKSASTSTDTKRLALQKLIDLNPAFRSALQGQTIDLQKLDEAYRNVTESIKAQALAQAAAGLATEKQKKVLQLSGLRQRIETESAIQGNKGFVNVSGLSDEEKDILLGGLFGNNLTNNTSLRDAGGDNINFLAKDLEKILKFVGQRENEAIDVYQLYLENQAEKEKELLAIQNRVREQATKNAVTVSQGFEVDIAELRQQIDDLDEQIKNYQGSRAGLDKLVTDRAALQKQLDDLLNKTKKTPERASKISGPEQDKLRDIDANRDLLLAQERLKRVQNQIDEETYLQNILRINQEAIDKKLTLIKGSNAAERKLIADLRLERITAEQETNNKIFELRKTALQIQLDNEVKNAQETARTITDDPTSSAGQRAQAKLDADKIILQLQIKHAADIDQLEKQLGQQSLKNAKEAADDVRKTKQQILTDEKELTLASLKDIQDAGTKSVAEFRAIISQQRLAVINNEDLSPQRKGRALSRLDKEENIGILAREVASLQNQLPVYKRLLAEKKITDEQYFKFVEELNHKQEELAKALETSAEDALRKITDVKSAVQNALRDLLKIKPGSNEDNILGEAIAETYSLAQDAMNAYFDAEAQRIQDSRDAQLEKLDLEKQTVLRRATSQAEIDQIEKQYAAKKKDIEKKAGEELKKNKREEAKIAFAVEIANLAASSAALPWPLNLINFGIQAAIASIRYSLTQNRINSAKFAYGGRPGDVPARGGKFGGKPHSHGGTPFDFKGQSYEAQVDELAVIRTQDAPRNKIFSVVGTQSQLASAANVIGGGVNFAPGAKMKKFAFGGNLGESLQAPVFIPSGVNTLITTGGGMSADQFNTMMAIVIGLSEEQSKRIDRMEVVQVTSTVTAAQNKQTKQSEVGTL